jgi:PrcB C-terminal
MGVMLLLFATGCSSGPSADGAPETTGSSEPPRDLRVERISSNAPGEGPEEPRVVVAASAAALSDATGTNIKNSGDGTYLAAYWGEKPTGGYSMSVRSARLEGSRVMVELLLKEPPRDAILTQALTYPHAVAVIWDLSPEGKNFSFKDEKGRRLGWPVRRAGG